MLKNKTEPLLYYVSLQGFEFAEQDWVLHKNNFLFLYHNECYCSDSIIVLDFK